MRLDSNVVYMYVSSAQLVLQHDFVATTYEQRVYKLNQKLPRLRQLLSCAVCMRLLSDPYAPREGRCYHNVCRLCVRGKKRLQPLCDICKDYQDFKIYDENRQMRCLMLCFKSLCEHLMSSNTFAQLSKQKPVAVTKSTAPAIPMPNLSPQEVVLEGASYEDVLNTFAVDLPRQMPEKLARQSAESTVDDESVVSSGSSIPVAVAAVAAGSNITSAASSSSGSINLMRIAATAPIGGITAQHLQNALQCSQTQAAAAQSTTGSNIAAAASSTTTPTKQYGRAASPSIASAAASSTVNLSPQQAQNFNLQQLGNMIDISAMMKMPNNAAVVSSSNSSNRKEATSSSGNRYHFLAANKSNQNIRNCATNAPLTIASKHRKWTPNMLTASSSSNVNNRTNVHASNVETFRNNVPDAANKRYPMYQTAAGNRLTFKRKTNPNVLNNQQQLPTPSNMLMQPLPAMQPPAKPNVKRKGCRCGKNTQTPGKLTCCGQRCTCYTQNKHCDDLCECYGCHNPHRPGGVKLTPNALQSNHNILSSSSVGMNALERQMQQQLPSSTEVSTSMLLPMRAVGMREYNSTTTTAMLAQHNTQPTTYNRQQNNTANILQIETLPRDSMLIQNVGGKYQVLLPANAVGQNHLTQTASMPALQRIHAGGIAANNMPTVGNAFLIPTVTNAAATNLTTTPATSHMRQIFYQTQNMQLPLRRSNFITVHSMPHNTAQTQAQAQPQLPTMSAQAIVPLSSPIIVTSQSTFVSNVFPDSSGRCINPTNVVNANSSNAAQLMSTLQQSQTQQQQQQQQQAQQLQCQPSTAMSNNANTEEGADSTTAED